MTRGTSADEVQEHNQDDEEEPRSRGDPTTSRLMQYSSKNLLETPRLPNILDKRAPAMEYVRRSHAPNLRVQIERTSKGRMEGGGSRRHGS